MLADYDEIQVGLCAAYAERWPALQNVPFYLAVGDGAAAQVGSGAVRPNTIALTVGTTSALRRVSTGAPPPIPDGLWSYRIDRKHHLTGGALSEGGNLFAWTQQVLNLDEDIETKLRQRKPASHGQIPFKTAA